MPPDTDFTIRLESAGIGLAHAISPAAAKYCRGQRRSGARNSPGARCASGVCACYRHRPDGRIDINRFARRRLTRSAATVGRVATARG
jgi:hypothetical protein